VGHFAPDIVCVVSSVHRLPDSKQRELRMCGVACLILAAIPPVAMILDRDYSWMKTAVMLTIALLALAVLAIAKQWC
jgi:uncharacterized membrane protein YcjF (UPF0283 family)